MMPLRVLLADADLVGARGMVAELVQMGATVVLGARTQERIARLDSASGAAVFTVPVGDAVDGEVVLTTVEDAIGVVGAVVIPVEAAEGRVEARVRPVAETMALAEGLAAAAVARGAQVVVVGPGADAVVAFVRPLLSDGDGIVAVADVAALRAFFMGAAALQRRRDRLSASARGLADRVMRWGRS